MWSSTAQPSTRREQPSRTAHRYGQPSSVAKYVMSDVHPNGGARPATAYQTCATIRRIAGLAARDNLYSLRTLVHTRRVPRTTCHQSPEDQLVAVLSRLGPDPLRY
jgi:hypothetical protein